MSNVRDDQEPRFGADESTPLKRAAKNKDERRATLNWWLDNDWANQDIGRLEREDSVTEEGEVHGWWMWRWKRDSGEEEEE